MRIKFTETVSTLVECYQRNKAYDLGDADAALYVSKGLAQYVGAGGGDDDTVPMPNRYRFNGLAGYPIPLTNWGYANED